MNDSQDESDRGFGFAVREEQVVDESSVRLALVSACDEEALIASIFELVTFGGAPVRQIAVHRWVSGCMVTVVGISQWQVRR